LAIGEETADGGRSPAREISSQFKLYLIFGGLLVAELGLSDCVADASGGLLG